MSRTVARLGREQHLLVVAVSFAVTVLATRWYLAATGYPKVGGGRFHLAHAIWGGLLLTVALQLVLLWSGRRVLLLAAVMGGAGAGLFVDEVGKFITSDNDYFFPLAAPLIYASALGLVAVAVVAGRRRQTNPAQRLGAVLIGLSYIAAGDRDDRLVREVQLGLAGLQDAPDAQRSFAAQADDWLASQLASDPPRLSWLGKLAAWASAVESHLPTGLMRCASALSLSLLGLTSLVYLITIPFVWAATVDSDFASALIADGIEVGGGEKIVLLAVGLMALVAGIFALMGLILLIPRPERAARWGERGLLVVLVGIDTVAGYLDFIWLTITVVGQLLGLLVLARYRARLAGTSARAG